MKLRAILIALALAFPADAAEPLSGADIGKLISAALAQAGQRGEPVLSPNRGFPPCGADPVVTKGGRDWSTARVQCTVGTGWSRNIRIKDAKRTPRAAQIRRNPDLGDTVWVLSESLSRGTVIAPEHVRAQPVADLDRLPDGVIGDATRIIGRTLKANLGEGRVIQARHLEFDWYVTEGSYVVIETRTSSIAIQTGGTAQQSGQLGERIRVENRRSGRIIEATVAGRNLVRTGSNIP